MIGAETTVQPAYVMKSDGTSAHFSPLSVGSFVHIGNNVSISALAIGSHVVIGDGAIIENGVDVKSCVVVTSGSVVKQAATLPSHTGDLHAGLSLHFCEKLNLFLLTPRFYSLAWTAGVLRLCFASIL